jgi:hypothetical protein
MKMIAYIARTRLRALELAGVRVDHGVVAGAEVACVLAGSRRHAAAAAAADVAHLVAHLVLPVVAAAHHATRRAVCSIDRSADNSCTGGGEELAAHCRYLSSGEPGAGI